MEPEKVLDLGSKYSKKDLSNLLDQPNLSFVREGIFNCKNSSSSLFFVDLEKKDKETKSIVMIGEIGGTAEEEAADFVKNHEKKKSR